MANMISQLCRLDGNLSWIGSGKGEPNFNLEVTSFFDLTAFNGIQSSWFVCSEPEIGHWRENADLTNCESLTDERANKDIILCNKI